MKRSVPAKPASGEYWKDPSGSSVSAPWAAVVDTTARSGPPPGFVSLPRTPGAGTVSRSPSVVVYASSWAVGSAAAVTERMTFAVLERQAPAGGPSARQ